MRRDRKWKMNPKVVLAMAAVLGLLLLPLAVVVYVLAHTKGAAGLAWPAIDLGRLDPVQWLASLGLHPDALSVDRLLHQLASGPSGSNATGNPRGVGGASGAAGGASGGARPPDPLEKRIDKYIDDVKKYLKKEWEATKRALFEDPPPSGSQSGQGGKK
jgi:hypothetical protein